MNDDNKQKILDSLNYFRQHAKSVNSIPVGIRDLQAYAKKVFELKQQEVAVSLDYLIEHGWVDKVTEERSIQRGSAFIPTSSSKYKLSALGISQFDADSRFDTSSRYSGINIGNVNGVVVLGNNNVVNNKYRDLFTQLDNLERKIKLSEHLSEIQKLDASADVQSVKDQLAKDVPNASVVNSLLTGLSVTANIAGTIDLLKMIIDVVHRLM